MASNSHTLDDMTTLILLGVGAFVIYEIYKGIKATAAGIESTVTDAENYVTDTYTGAVQGVQTGLMNYGSVVSNLPAPAFQSGSTNIAPMDSMSYANPSSGIT